MMLESQRTAQKETSLIETINIISKDNTLLKEQIDSLKNKLMVKQSNLVDQETQAATEITEIETQTDKLEICEIGTQYELEQTEISCQTENVESELVIETNVLGDFEIVKDVFNTSSSGEENKCIHCNRKLGSRGSHKRSQGEDGPV